MNYCINRDDRPERWADVQKEFDRVGIEVIRYPAKVNKIGWMGCRDSHLSCVVKIFNSEETGTIFEDDVVFLCGDNDFRHHLTNAMFELPSGWDILYLGASPQEPCKRYSQHLYRLGKSFTTHAMMWNLKGKAMDVVLDADDKNEIGKWDVFLYEKIHPNFNVFVTHPILCVQRQYQSDTCRRSDVSTILLQYHKYCP